MFFWLACGLFALALAAAAAGFHAHLRALDKPYRSDAAAIGPDRYQSFIRLLQNPDIDLPDDQRASASLKDERRARVRAYLRALTNDYGRVLQQLQVMVVDSNTDRPDLVSILERNRLTFAWMMCRIDLHLCLDRWGIGDMDLVTRDAIALVEGFRAIQLRAKFLTESAVWGH